MDITEVATKGGMSTLQKYGKEHYSKMGKAKKGKKSPGSGRHKLTQKDIVDIK